MGFIPGAIVGIMDGVLLVSHLSGGYIGELVFIKKQENPEYKGQVIGFDSFISKVVIIFGDYRKLGIGDKVFRTHTRPSICVGFCNLGKIISTNGDILNNVKDPILFISKWYREMEAAAPTIMQRLPVRIPVLTGLNAVDTMLPVGCGQRELIIGDRATGKTSMAITIILNQSQYIYNGLINNKWKELSSFYDFVYHPGFRPFVYVSIGQRRSEVSRIYNLLMDRGLMQFCSIVTSTADDHAGSSFLAPYSGTTIAEWFRDMGYNCVILYDDLSNHAIAYRQMSLLLRRPPGREAFPGDIFYVHSRLLERTGQLKIDLGSGSVTSFPVIETKGNDISAYIPTNVISITDGQIMLSSDLVAKNVRPAINLGLSVSRVGSKAQYSSLVKMSNIAKQYYRYYADFANSASVGRKVSDSIFAMYINRGSILTHFFQQYLYYTTSYYQLVISLYFISKGYLDSISSEHVSVYLALLFNNGLMRYYLKSFQYTSLLDISLLNSWLMAYDISFIESILFSWIELYVPFFYDELQPRFFNDHASKLLRRALEGEFFDN